MIKRWAPATVALALVVLLAWSPARPPTVHAATTWQVTIGTDVEAENIGLDAYFPHVLTINAGDTVNWNFAGFHTVTFNAGQPDLPLLMPGPNPGDLQLGPAFFPYPPGPNPPSGNYDGSTQISSGTPPQDLGPGEMPPPFTLTFTKAGVYTYECMIHPGMHGVLTVVAAGASLPESPAQATARGQGEASMLEDAIRGQAAQIQAASGAAPSGTRAATVAVGTGYAEGASMLAFLPSSVTVRAGDLVTFTNTDPFEIHTVTFLSGGAPPDFITPVGEPTNGPPTLVIMANVAGPAGGPVYSGQGYFNSGIIGDGQSYVLAFDTPGTYQYQCLVHDNMKGTITVTP